MNYGFLSDYFEGIAAKRLSDVEIKPEKSNQHEFNGINEFKDILGSEKTELKGRYIYLSDDEDQIIKDRGNLTWYDARENHLTRTEYRLYYSTNSVIRKATSGDLIVFCKEKDNNVFIIIASAGSTSESQILWLFGLTEDGVKNKFIVKTFTEEKKEIDFATKHIFQELEIKIEEPAADYLTLLLEKYGVKFPTTHEFSEFSRSLLKDINPTEEPDKTLISWMEQEEMLFKTLEKHIIGEQLKKGFGKDNSDVDQFISFSLSVQNRRKSRAGKAFENHLASIFDANGLKYSHGVKTERNNKPDFLFPGIAHYNDPNFSDAYLTMLGVKTSAKDRWRQVLVEADRVKEKHLITLEPAISRNQTDEMTSQNLKLVIPSDILNSYTTEQRKYLLSVYDFITILKRNQAKTS